MVMHLSIIFFKMKLVFKKTQLKSMVTTSVVFNSLDFGEVGEEVGHSWAKVV